MADVALTLWALYGLLAAVVPLALQRQRTGSSGFKGPSGRLGSLEWLAGAGLLAAIALGVAAAVLVQREDVEPIASLDHTAVHAIGIGLYALGLVIVVFSQQWMGRSWRIGVDEGERTELVTGGPFRFVRNPIYTGMTLVTTGLALLVPNALSLASVVILIVSLSVQTRLVEEPHLMRLHGDAYRCWATRVGRFIPGVGRLR
jgi:protein-S-isoprenylcysteine O-methyltransferase Ste14